MDNVNTYLEKKKTRRFLYENNSITNNTGPQTTQKDHENHYVFAKCRHKQDVEQIIDYLT